MTDTRYAFSYNSKLSVKSPSGTKQTYVIAKSKREERSKIKEYLNSIDGELCLEFF